MIRRPDRIRIGAVTYRLLADRDAVAAVSDRNAHPGGYWAAFSDHNQLVIGVNPETAPDVNKVDVLHEVIHCCLRTSGVWPDSYAAVIQRADGFNDGQSVEEMMVSGTAAVLLAVMRDNPDLVAWLLDDVPVPRFICTCGAVRDGMPPPYPPPADHATTCAVHALAS